MTIKDIADRHQLNRPIVEYPAQCKVCHQPWPCDASVFLAELRAVTERGADFYRLAEQREGGWLRALRCRQDRIRDLKETLKAVREAYAEHKFSESRRFMQRVGRILEGGE